MPRSKKQDLPDDRWDFGLALEGLLAWPFIDTLERPGSWRSVQTAFLLSQTRIVPYLPDIDTSMRQHLEHGDRVSATRTKRKQKQRDRLMVVPQSIPNTIFSSPVQTSLENGFIVRRNKKKREETKGKKGGGETISPTHLCLSFVKKSLSLPKHISLSLSLSLSY